MFAQFKLETDQGNGVKDRTEEKSNTKLKDRLLRVSQTRPALLPRALRVKLLHLATVTDNDGINALGFADRDAFVDAQIKSFHLSP